MYFDVRTILELIAVGNFLVFILLLIFIIYRRNRNLIITIYAVTKLIIFLSYVFFASREHIPEKLSIITGNSILFIGISLEAFCVVSTRMDYSRRNLLKFLIPSIVYSVAFSLFVNAPDYVRIAIASFHPFAYILTGSIFLLTTRRRSGLQYFMSILYMITAIFLFWRMYVALFIDHDLTLYTPNNVQTASLILLFFITHLGVVYILISFKEQDEEKIRAINELTSADNIQLKELNATKDKFFSIIAHDLKSPIGALAQLVEVLANREDRLPPDYRQKILMSVYTHSRNTYHLLNNLLLWAQSESGMMKYNPEVLDMKKLFNENISLLKGNADIKNITLITFEKKTQVYADRYMINSVIRNLLSNAIKFTSEGGTIKINLHTMRDGKCTFGVCDTGTGIKKEIVSGLFSLDSEYTSLGTAKEKGSGLGLKLCFEFIKRNRGEIWVESEWGRGSTFYFTLPLTDEAEQ